MLRLEYMAAPPTIGLRADAEAEAGAESVIAQAPSGRAAAARRRSVLVIGILCKNSAEGAIAAWTRAPDTDEIP
jgi:hypothetical protein